MTSFQISVPEHRRAAARLVSRVHRLLARAYADAPDVSQTQIANLLGVHRSVINRQLRGRKDMSVGRIAELAFALGLEPDFSLIAPENDRAANEPKLNVKLDAPHFVKQSVGTTSSVIRYAPAKALVSTHE